MKKRFWAGSVLLLLGLVLCLLPIHIEMTGMTAAGYGILCFASCFAEKRGWRRGWQAAIIAVGAAVAVILTSATAAVLAQGRSDWNEARQADYVVVLGAQVRGEEPSRTLRARLDTALALMEENREAVFIVSGGKGTDEQLPEAEVMYRYMAARGADLSRLYREPEATNTRENLQYSTAIAASLGLVTESPAIVTSEFHLCRARYIAKSLGLTPCGVGSETMPGILMLNYALREVFAFVKAFMVNII